MAIIKCQECGKEISDRSATCIHCGCPVKKVEGIESTQIKNKEVVGKKLNAANIVNLCTILGVGIMFAIIVFQPVKDRPDPTDEMVMLMMGLMFTNFAIVAITFVIGLIIWFRKKESPLLSCTYLFLTLTSCLLFLIGGRHYLIYMSGFSWFIIIPNIIQIVAGIMYVRNSSFSNKKLLKAVVLSIVIAIALGMFVPMAMGVEIIDAPLSAQEAAEETEKILESTQKHYEETLNEIDEVEETLEELEEMYERLNNAN